MRPRGWHLVEKHLKFHDRARRAMHASGSLVDFGLYVFHNAHGPHRGRPRTLLLPAEARVHREAKLWNDIFVLRAGRARYPAGPIRATVLIETIQAAFQMDEILYELRDHCAASTPGAGTTSSRS
jgi:malate synthase